MITVQVFVVVLYILVMILCSEIDLLPLNPNCTFASDIKALQFNKARRAVRIELNAIRRCDNPSFVVRLSGTALHKLVLEEHTEHSYLFGYPPILDSGVYFIEVVAVYCTALNPNDYKDKCVEEVQEGRDVVTLPLPLHLEASTTSANSGATNLMSRKQARWVYAPPTDKPELAAPAYLPTRYQKGCGLGGSVFCEAVESELWQHRLYKWTDGPPWEDTMNKYIAIKASARHNRISNNSEAVNVCFVGDSHSRYLTAHAMELSVKVKGLQFVHTKQVNFPNEFSLHLIQEAGCNIVIFSMGQWLLSGRGHEFGHITPYTATKFEAEMFPILEKFSNLQKNTTNTSTVKVFIRSINYNGFGYFTTPCPPTDWRTPPVIDMLNSLSVNMTTQLGLDYIDLNHIIGPLWDSALDFCHPIGAVFTAEVEWVLYHSANTLLLVHAT